MSLTVTLNGVSHTIPQLGESSWGDNVTNYLVALASGVLQKAGGTFTLTADADFGANFGLKSLYYKSRSADVATVGQIRLANTDTIRWRNSNNTADYSLVPGSDGFLNYGAVQIANVSASQTLTNKTISGASNTLSNIPNGATTATSANTASAIVARDGSGNFSAGTITATLSGNATNVSGTVAIANGGTGAATAANAITALLPSQAGNAGKLLTSNGTAASWSTTLQATGAADASWEFQNTNTGAYVSRIAVYSADTTSSSNTPYSYFTSQSVNQRWDLGQRGSKNFTLYDTTNARAVMTAADTGAVTFSDGVTASAITATTATISGGSITGITDLAVADGGTGASTASAARTNLGLGTIATQASSSVTITGGSITGITDLAVADGGTGASSASAARTNLGLGTIATQDAASVTITGGSVSGITDLAVADGGTGASSASAARTNLGLGTIATQDASTVAISGGSVTGLTTLSAAGNDFVLNDDAAGSGADWTATLRRPAAGMTAAAVLTVPTATTTLAGLGLAQTFSAQQTFSAGARLVGATDGTNVAATYVGEPGSVTITSSVTSSATAETFVDSTQTLTLEAGRWLILVNSNLIVGLNASATTPKDIYGVLALRTGSTTITQHSTSTRLASTSDYMLSPVNISTYVSINAQTIYKLSVSSNQANNVTGGYVISYANNSLITGTNNKVANYITAIRIG